MKDLNEVLNKMIINIDAEALSKAEELIVKNIKKEFKGEYPIVCDPEWGTR